MAYFPPTGGLFVEVPWRGASNDSWVVRTGDFW